MHFNHILTENNFFELSERELIQSETYQVSKYRENGGIVFSIGHSRIGIEYYIVGCLEEPFIPFNAIEYLFQKHPLGILTFYTIKKLSCM